MPCAEPDAADGVPVLNPPWPAWLEGARVPDSLSSAAYEATPPRYRAALKTGLALAHFQFGESLARRDETLCDGRLGFRRAVGCCPAPWALIVFPPAYAAAARLTAACAAALLAGVPQVGAICLGDQPSAPALVSLELSGVEDIFQPDSGAFAALMEELSKRHTAQPGSAPGRVALLHAGELDGVARSVRAIGIPCCEERRPPRLRIEAGAGIDRELLAFAHGGPVALDAALTAAGPVDAVYRSAEAAAMPAPEAPLCLSPGCEGFWLHPGLSPEFFTISRQAFALWAPRTRAPAAS